MKISIPYGASETGEIKSPIPIERTSQRISKEILIAIPNTTNTVTFTFNLYDENGYKRATQSNIPKNDATLLLLERIIKPGYSVGIQASGATGTDITIDIYIDFATYIF